MTDKFKPMLADNATLKDIKFPCYASPKLDGVRGLILDGTLFSRSLKKFPNKHVQELYSKPEFNGLDGEFVLGDPTANDSYRETTSAIMRINGEPKLTFYAFDDFTEFARSFTYRYECVLNRIKDDNELFKVLTHKTINNIEELEKYEEDCINQGYEGVMIRSLTGLYKCGRSTVRQGWLLKLKRFLDSEAEITGFIEMNHNNNEAKTNELGRTHRSSHKENLIPMGTLGAITVKDVHYGWEFEIGSGFTAEERSYFWNNQSELLGKIVTYKYFPVGMKDSPRHATYKGLRDLIDFEVKK